MTTASTPVTGILLAAGRGRRFDPTGACDKLMQKLPEGGTVALCAAKNLLLATPSVLAVVRPGAVRLARELTALGCEVLECPDADNGMGATLAFAIGRRTAAAGWLVALADMPYVSARTGASLVAAIEAGAAIAVPVCQSRRGNPVAFGQRHLADLLSCSGDQGARHLLRTCAVTEVAVEDTGIWHDIDCLGDLRLPVG